MIKVKHSNREYEVEDNVTGFQLLKLLKDSSVEQAQVIAIKSNGTFLDLSATIKTNTEIELITTNTEDGLNILRHSTAHLLAYAVQELYGANVKFSIGPAIENGFYYDFDIETPFSEDDFVKIEAKMNELIKKDEKFAREVLTRKDALKYFDDKKEIYKVELINDLPDSEEISIYKVGNFADLCRGVHVPSTRYLKNFKLTKVAGAYHRGDSKNRMLQRIYGIAFDTPEKLAEHLKMLEEAEKRDHRKICKSMDILHFEPDYAPGAVFFHQKGFYMFNKLIEYMREKQEREDYVEVSTPRLMDRSLWETSGHLENYKEHIYLGETEDGKQFCVKPMNCPGAVLMYKHGLRSYRDLPLKIAEFGKVNRYEASGAIMGLLRVREFTQDDAHIFCAPGQVQDEVIKLIQFLLGIYEDFGFNNVKVKLSTRPKNRMGSEEIWDLSEKALADALKFLKLDFSIFEGEGAFYGPKLEFVLKDSIGRDWQVGTIQVDMNLPSRFGITYIGEDGAKHEPIMLHRAILGSIERFLGIFIENTEGKFPLWISPLQIGIATITDESKNYANYIYDRFNKEGLKAKLDTSNEKISYKIREMSLEKIPYVLVIGNKESQAHTVNIRTIDETETIDLSLDDFIEKINFKIRIKDRDYNLK